MRAKFVVPLLFCFACGADTGGKPGAAGADSGLDENADSGTDSGADSGADTGANEQPVVTFLAPEEGSAWAEGDDVLVTVLVEDDHDPVKSFALGWTSLPDGASPPFDLDADGTVSFWLRGLSYGTYRLGVRVEDSEGAVGRARVQFTVVAQDADGDGYAGDTDCDDGDPTVHRFADELCNGVDDDCDGSVDETSAVDAPTWFLDADADGYGDAMITSVACSAPDGYVPVGTDCDDAAPDAHPGGTEVCGDGRDNDCDGSIDDAAAVDALAIYVDADGDGYGDPSTGTLACTVPVGHVLVGTDCDDGAAAVHPSAHELCNGVDDDCEAATGELEVPAAYPTVADALTAAGEGEAICLAAGTHTGGFDLARTRVTVQGQGRGVTFLDLGTETVRVDGGGLADLTITGSDGSAPGVYCAAAAGEVWLQGVTFQANDCEGASCATLLYVYGCELVFDDLVLSDNARLGDGGSWPVLLAGFAALDGDSLTFDRNAVSSGTGAPSLLAASYVTFAVDELVATDNEVTTEGGNDGALLDLADVRGDLGAVTLVGNGVDAGGALDGGLLFLWPSEPIGLGRLTLQDNVVTGSGSGATDVVDGGLLSVARGAATARYVDVRGNRVSAARLRGGLVGLYDGAELGFDNALVAGNEVSAGEAVSGGLFYAGAREDSAAGSEGVLRYADVSHNVVAGGEISGGAFCGDYGGGGEAGSSGWTLAQVNVVANDVSGEVYGSVYYDDSATYSYRTEFVYSNIYGNGGTAFENHPDPTGSDGNVAYDPDYTDVTSADPSAWDLTLAAGSPVEDAGPSDASSNDADGSRSGIGAYSGPDAAGW